ncbi:MAG: hypothetical protein CL840_15835 [Crocinitomicaceae bacterium]|nr:hypothetical protein [Crocinitomicaceae bacterium]|tara:strand:+ start:28790 stop:29617 length:828 start_codon:yes stop_codon:yes gene_type:complete
MSSKQSMTSKLDAMAEHAKRNAPSEDELLARTIARFEKSKKDPNHIENWFHAVIANGIRHPKTQLIPFPIEATIAILKEDQDAFFGCKELDEVEQAVKRAFDTFGKDALFLKNSLYSGKHTWNRTCHITRDSNIRNHLGQITYEWLMRSPVYATHMVVRELIETAPVFHAFGGTPIVQEFRLFAKDGKTYAYQAYWPANSILDADTNDWAQKLESISEATQQQMDEMIKGADRVTRTLRGDWSVDFLIDKDGAPWLIDMAVASQSYISPHRIELS